MQAVAFAVVPAQAFLLRQAAEALLADQQAAREDIGLDEIGIGGIKLEQIVADRDDDAQAAERARNATETELRATIRKLEAAGRPEDVAAMIAYLASTEARFVTGAAFTIDGGVGAS